ncbi:MAG: YbjQ family protein [Candidatus Nanohaloarchaea archaeon]|nr:YbjQ family protein [Candidatus Nanohaloarchaea archaeon]
MTAFDFQDDDVLVTTSHSIDENIDEYLGIVISDVTPGRHLGKDFMSGLRNIFGGRSRSWERTLRENQEQAMQELADRAEDMGADAVIAVDMEDEAVGAGNMMNIKAVGTAVKLE